MGASSCSSASAAPLGVALGGNGRHPSPKGRQLGVKLRDAPLKVADTRVCKTICPQLGCIMQSFANSAINHPP